MREEVLARDAKITRPLVQVALLCGRRTRTVERTEQGVSLAQHSRESFDHVARQRIDVGEQRRKKISPMFRSTANDIDTLGREYRERQSLGELSPRAGTLTVNEHAFGGVAYSPRQREVDLNTALALEDHSVHLGRCFAVADHVARCTGAKG